MADDCYSCAMNAQLDSLSAREAILVEGVWRVAHAFDSALAGWLVVVPLRHVGALDELTAAEVAPLGSLLRRLSAALREVTGATKSYFMFFAEAEGFAHLHIHVVPRMPTFTPDQLGPKVFGFLGRPADERVSEAEQDGIALELRARLALQAVIAVDGGSAVPPFEQVRAQLAAQIADGLLVPGTRLPTVRQLADDLGLAVNTVARSYRELEAAGMVETRGRGGTVVTTGGDQARERLLGAAQRYAALARDIGLSADEALRLVGTALNPSNVQA